MSKRTQAYIAALPLSSLPELQDLLCRFTGADEKRGHVVMVRLGDDAAMHLDRLVEAGMFGSRSEAAAFLIGTGIDANKKLLQEAARHCGEISKIRGQLKDAIVKSLRAAPEAAAPSRVKSGEKRRRSRG